LLASLGPVHGLPGSAHAAARQGSSSAQALLPVALPDVSRLHASVQQQLRDAHASLMTAESRTDVSPRERADAFGEMGMLFMATRFGDEAERCYRNAQRLAPEDVRWPYYLGHVQKDADDLSAAAESFERARQLRPTNLATLLWLGRVYLDLAQPAAAEARLGEALTLEPNQPAVRFELGWAALAQQDYARAVEQLTAASTLDPEATVIHYPLALAYRGLGDLDRATHHFERRGSRGSGGDTTAVAFTLPDPLLAALNGMVRTPQFYRDRGSDAAAAGNWPEAVENLRRAAEAEPDDADTRVNLGTALERVGDARAAVERYEEALRLDPRQQEAHYGLGELLERSGRDEEAIERYGAAVQEDPTFVAAHLKLADALRRTDRLEQSLSHYREVIALQPADVGARFGEAMALVRLQRYAESRDRLTEAMRVRPDLSMFRHALARVLAAAPDDHVRDGARAWSLVEALPEEEQHPAVFETMAMALAELGYFDLAIDWQRLAMSAAARAGRSDVAQQMAANLALYARRQPCRMPWREDDPDHRPGPPVDPGLLESIRR
jgi:tetratricopeptide (TPR) repeat protein